MRRLVIGLGNPARGDDAAGLEVAKRLEHTPALARQTASVDLIEDWEAADEVIVVDAMRSGAPPGAVRRFDAIRTPIETMNSTSTHGFGISEIVELARTLDRLPSKLTVYGIELRSAAMGTEMSPEVADAVDRVVAEIEAA